jgi:hypothetical protein
MPHFKVVKVQLASGITLCVGPRLHSETWSLTAWDGHLTVRSWAPLVPPLEQPRLPVLPAGARTATLKLPGAGIMEDVMLTVS